jgi:hypothetical protein
MKESIGGIDMDKFIEFTIGGSPVAVNMDKVIQLTAEIGVDTDRTLIRFENSSMIIDDSYDTVKRRLGVEK